MDYESSLLMDASTNLDNEDPLANSNKDEMIKEFLRKNFLKFYINIFKDTSQETSSVSRSSMMGSKATNASGGGIGNFGSTLSGNHPLLDDAPT